MSLSGLTLYILHTERPPEIAADGIAAARWASRHTCSVLLVTDQGRGDEYAECGADYVYESEVPGSGPLADFRFYDALRYAIQQGADFEQVVCFRDDATFLGRAVDDALSKTFYNESVDFVGVADRHYYGEHFLRVGNQFSAWRVPHETWDKPPNSFTAHSAVFALTHKLAKELFFRRLLLPVDWQEWPLPFGTYATWTCQLMMMSLVFRGSMDRPVFPFYLNDGWGGTYNPPPYLLHQNTQIYWSLRRVAGYSEVETRSWCKSLRQANQ